MHSKIKIELKFVLTAAPFDTLLYRLLGSHWILHWNFYLSLALVTCILNHRLSSYWKIGRFLLLYLLRSKVWIKFYVVGDGWVYLVDRIIWFFSVIRFNHFFSKVSYCYIILLILLVLWWKCDFEESFMFRDTRTLLIAITVWTFVTFLDMKLPRF